MNVNGSGEARGSRVASVCFAITAASGVGLAVVYAQGGSPQLEGGLLALAFGALGTGLVTVAHSILDQGQVTEPHERLVATPPEEQEVDDALDRGRRVSRRRVLVTSFVSAVGALGVAALFPIRSLGPAPKRSLYKTNWRNGRRAVTEDGSLVVADDVPIGGIVTIFPEGAPGSADSQVVLIRVRESLLRSGQDGAAGDLIAFSKVCTHAGCPVGLYEADTHQLLCPCHQSAFDVLDRARPVFGPAASRLPQLPIMVDEDGHVVARGDFPEPVGPAFWSRG